MGLGQCPTCGRVDKDWSERHGPTKGKQRKDSEDRVVAYRNWRHKFGGGCYVCDIDQLEWRIVGEESVPVATIELSRVDGNRHLPQSYLDAVLTRFNKRDGQGKTVRMAAHRLGVKAWIVLFRWDLSEFWIYNLTDSRGWWTKSADQYRLWIKGMQPTRKRREPCSQTREEWLAAYGLLD